MTKLLLKALCALAKYHVIGGASCSMIGLACYVGRNASCNRAREGGALLYRLRELGFAHEVFESPELGVSASRRERMSRLTWHPTRAGLAYLDWWMNRKKVKNG